ncbi:MAG: hypothetical protein OSP8Acid_07890 [uncultured Acidilobus sp. OSP8]|jgi:hypothetical protein|nr:MAG: hypothetical protein OSP8Acid_07890 [uncultured Acidilobus sp. OSP8]
MVLKVKVRHIKAREVKGRKEVGSKVYEYEYFTLPLNIYVKKHVIERWGSEFTVEVDDDLGVICVKPKSIGDLLGLTKCPSVPPRS